MVCRWELSTFCFLLVLRSSHATGFCPSFHGLSHGQRQLQSGTRLCLRGGGEQEEAVERFEASLAELSKQMDDLNRRVDGPEDTDVFGHSKEGIPLSYHPQNAEIVQEPEYDSDEFNPRPKHGAWEPREEDLKAGMEMVEWMDDVVERMKPENILEGVKALGGTPDDLQPVINKRGTRVGSLYEFDKSRDELKKTLDEVKDTHAQLRVAMKQRAPADELMDEIKQMKEEDVNPYVKLLHEWKKKSTHEHESGSFQKQFEAITQPQLTVERGRQEEENKMETQVQLEAPKPSVATATSTLDQ